MRIASMMVVAALALWSIAHPGRAAAADACEPNFYTIDMTWSGSTDAATTDFKTVLDAAVTTKCYSELTSPKQGHIFCMYDLVGGTPPPTPEMMGIFAGLSITTPRTGGDGLVQVKSVKTQITCKPKPIETCVQKACSLGTMLVPNCKACGP